MADKTEQKETNIEREYVIPLRGKFRHVVRYKKTPKAIKSIKEFLARHMKIYDRDLNKIKLDKSLNEFIWSRGIKNPPHKVKVKAVKDGENIKVELAELPEKLKFKKAKEEKIEAKAIEIAEKKKTAVQRLKEKSETEKQTEEEKVEEKEKKTAVVEEGKKLEKEMAKKAKHSTGGKTKQPKRPVRQAMAK